ncbi:unnamed protein product [Rotaria sordida]|uniref:G-protein coupled receptors family 1 profile domain-containing protein n=1 Tax=Rotaria sordida TaxID=392033 RepID=A0A819TQU5_9BILA|nr:unnamed protein product [Rotaria sordida]
MSSALAYLCLATIDQFLATCSSPRWQQLCHISLARRLCLTFIVLCNILQLGMFLYFLGVLPLSITVIFGCLAYRNVQKLSYRTIPLVRRKLDQQLTVMVLTQVVFNVFAITPYTIINAIILDPYIKRDPVANAISSSIRILSTILLYSCFASPFYIYICASERFRHQLVFVLCKMHL